MNAEERSFDYLFITELTGITDVMFKDVPYSKEVKDPVLFFNDNDVFFR